LRQVLYPRVYLPDFITSARRLLMFSWLFFCGVQTGEEDAEGELLETDALPVNGGLCARAAVLHLCCMHKALHSSTQAVHAASDPATGLRFTTPPLQARNRSCRGHTHRLLAGRGGHHLVEFTSFSACGRQQIEWFECPHIVDKWFAAAERVWAQQQPARQKQCAVLMHQATRNAPDRLRRVVCDCVDADGRGRSTCASPT